MNRCPPFRDRDWSAIESQMKLLLELLNYWMGCCLSKVDNGLNTEMSRVCNDRKDQADVIAETN
jgi:hypothetical protein